MIRRIIVAVVVIVLGIATHAQTNSVITLPMTEKIARACLRDDYNLFYKANQDLFSYSDKANGRVTEVLRDLIHNPEYAENYIAYLWKNYGRPSFEKLRFTETEIKICESIYYKVIHIRRVY